MKSDRVHMMGIGGVGMAALAVLLKRRGFVVSGCDLHDTPRTRWLAAQGILVATGHDPSHAAADEALIVTPAVPAEHSELVAFRAAGREVFCRGEVLAGLVSASEDSIAVCGSHGKTTTATWIARLLVALGERVEWAIGGETGDFPVAGCLDGGTDRHPASDNQTVGVKSPSVLVVEADESDGTLAQYHAKTLVITNCEYDHPDHFPTFADYLACYNDAKRNAAAVVDGAELDSLATLAPESSTSDDALAKLMALPSHNRQNARTAVEVAVRRGHPIAAVLRELAKIVDELPDRRFQPIVPGVYADYGHHPTEMRCAVSMARNLCPGKLRVLFQPHRYSRTKALLGDFPPSFIGADEVVICPVYSAFENLILGGSSADLYAECRKMSTSLGSVPTNAGSVPSDFPRFFLAQSCDEAWAHAANSMRDGDLTLLLGAGDIIDLVPKIKADFLGTGPSFLGTDPKKIGEKSPFKCKNSKIWLGAGSNTFKSDLSLPVEYVRTEGPAGEVGAVWLKRHPCLAPWMVGIPGTLGGWVKMNAGAFGHSISEVIQRVKVDGRWLTVEECGFSYRHSDIAGEIQDVEWLPDPIDQADDDLQGSYLSRRKHFPAGTFGSFFKNPEGDYAGRLLEAVGAKELKVGGAYVWNEHANVIVRGPDATSSDVLALAQQMHDRVLLRFHVDLEPEVAGLKFLGQ